MAQTVRKILVATDFGSSDRALETAVALATRFSAEMVVLHVVEEPVYAYPFPAPPEVRRQAKASLDEVVGGLRARMLQVSAVLREGIAWEQIGFAARDLDADLVVVGSQGRRGLPRFVLGSTAERVVRTSPVPVLTVHPYDAVSILAGGMDRFRHILAPTDLSERSLRGVEKAASLAKELGARLTLVYVFEAPIAEYYGELELAEQLEEQARRQLDELVATLRVRIPDVDGVATNGSPWREILDVGKSRGADLLVLGTSGRRGVPRMLLGSVAAKIVRLAEIPVLTVGP